MSRAEYYLAGAAIAGKVAAVDAEGIRGEMFADAGARRVFEAAVESSAKGHAFDIVRAGEVLGDIVQGREPSEVACEMLESYDTPATLPAYCAEVREGWVRRSKATAYTALAEAVRDGKGEVEAYWQKRLADIEAGAGGGAGTGFHVVRWGEFLAADYPPAVPVVDGFLNRGEIALLAAEPKLGKTWLALDLALSVGTGRPFLDFATRKGGVLYVNMEMGAGAMQTRAMRLAEAKGLTGGEEVQVYFIHALEESPPVTLDTFETRTDRAIDALGLKGQIALVVLDCYYAIGAGRDENDAQEVADAMMVFKRIATKHNAAFFLLHHTPKGGGAGRSVNDAARGSSAFAGTVDNPLRLTLDRETEDARWAKLAGNWRNMAGMPPQLLTFPKHGPPIWTREGTADPDCLARRGAPSRYSAATLVEAFHFDEERLTKAEILERTGMGATTFLRYLPESRLERMPDGRFKLPGGGADEL